MDVYISLQTGSSAQISAYNPTSGYKSYDATLSETSYTMRPLADLSGDGFPLDGSCQFYDSSVSPSASDGKLGLRGNAGQNVSLTISSSSTLTSITIATKNAATITVNGTTYTATGLNVVSLSSTSATITITPETADARVEVDYIVPGIILEITNDNLISCNLALRSNLNVADHTWEESEIEVKVYYPYSIADSFAYVENDWPITYQAGYDEDLSEERKFYLSEPIEQTNNVITIKGVDASHWLDSKQLQEQQFTTRRNASHKDVYDKFIDVIRSSGITIEKRQSWSAAYTGTLQFAVIPEMSARDFVSGVMNLTMNHKRGSTKYGIQFVDAGIPTVEHGDGTTFGNTWTINKSDLGDWSEVFEQNIAKIKNPNQDRKYNETFTIGNTERLLFSEVQDPGYITSSQAKSFTPIKKNEVLDLTYEGYYSVASGNTNLQNIVATPTRGLFKALNNSTLRYSSDLGAYVLDNEKRVSGYPVSISGGVSSFSNPSGLPGLTIELEPFIYGSITDSNGETVFNYPSLFNRSNKTISFTWKGDPRIQPLDYLMINDDTVSPATTKKYRISLIETSHEGGGTISTFEAREWT